MAGDAGGRSCTDSELLLHPELLSQEFLLLTLEQVGRAGCPRWFGDLRAPRAASSRGGLGPQAVHRSAGLRAPHPVCLSLPNSHLQNLPGPSSVLTCGASRKESWGDAVCRKGLRRAGIYAPLYPALGHPGGLSQDLPALGCAGPQEEKELLFEAPQLCAPRSG